MTYLPELRQAILDAARRHYADAAAAAPTPAQQRPSLSRRGRPLALLAVLVLAGTTGALAAAGVFRTGTPVGPQPGYAPVSNQLFGTAKPGSMRVLGLRVADPGGGAPWGIGAFQTTRGVACPVAGRLSGGRLGALGIDHAFADDGRFHPLLPAVSIDAACLPPDARGHLFLTGEGGIVNASGDVGPVAAIAQRAHCDLPGEHDWGVRCPQSALRALFYGFLGPDARSVSYTFDGVRHVEELGGPDGGYLVVLPAPPGSAVGRKANLGGFKAGPTLYATYADGRRCPVQSALEVSGPGSCALVGYVQVPAVLPPAAALATTAQVSYHAGLRYGGPAGLRLPGLLVIFTARVAVTDTRSAYAVEAQRPNTAACRRALALAEASGGGGFLPLEQNTIQTIAAGQTARIVLPLRPLCAGRYTGRLYFYRNTSPYNALAGLLPFPVRGRPGVTVATFAANIP
jgi:hypothetical protein